MLRGASVTGFIGLLRAADAFLASRSAALLRPAVKKKDTGQPTCCVASKGLVI